MMMEPRPASLGFGLGLRAQHYRDILDGSPAVDWFEVISENYMVPGGQPLRMLDAIAERYPVVMHGVSLSIASTSPFDQGYLSNLDALARRVKPRWVSDHLCWTGVHGTNLHDLLPGALHGRSTGACRLAHLAGSGFPWTAPRHRECIELYRV